MIGVGDLTLSPQDIVFKLIPIALEILPANNY